jgi:benzoyl-CoA reductase/2-hydroxyglutaryl-CoA dehydratase subunit BcrC/BadD/HgdB
MNRADPPLLSGEDLIKASSSMEFAPDRRVALETLESCIDELKRKAGEGYHIGRKNAPRILYTGCPVGSDDYKAIKLVEECGGLVVARE